MKQFDYSDLKEEEIILFLKDNVRPFFDRALFNWEFKSFKEGLVFKLYADGTDIVASQAMLPIKLVVNNTVIDTVKSENSFLNKNYRGHNHFENLYLSAIEDCKSKGHELVWGFTPAVKVWKNKLNFDVVDSNISEASISFSKYPSKDQLQKYTKNPLMLLAKSSAYSICRLFEKRKQFSLAGFDHISVIDKFPGNAQMLDYQKKISGLYDLSVHMHLSEEYINWRVTSNPVLKYEKLFFYNQSDLCGHVIYSIKDGRLAIADLSFTDQNIGKYILSYLLNKHKTIADSVFYFGNDDSVFGKQVFSIFSDFQARIAKSTWANTVILDITAGKKHAKQLDTSKWLINGLWTEGFSI